MKHKERLVEDDTLAQANKDFKEFEEKFGFKCYEEIKKQMAKMYEKIKKLTISRDNWKNKYKKLKCQKKP